MAKYNVRFKKIIISMKKNWCLEKLNDAATSEQFRRELKEKNEEAKTWKRKSYITPMS